MQLLISIGRRGAAAKSAADVQALIQQIEDYLSGVDPLSAGGVAHQEELLAQVAALSERLFGQQPPPFVRSAASKHDGAVEGLRDALAELELLRDTIALKQQVKPHLQQLQRVIDNTRSGSFDAGSAPGKPLILEGLRSVQLEEGTANSLALRCKYQSASPAAATWFLNGHPIDLSEPSPSRTRTFTDSNDGGYACLAIAPARAPALTADQSGSYAVLLKNANGEARSSCNVEIRPSAASPLSPEMELPNLVDQREVQSHRRARAPAGPQGPELGLGASNLNSDEYPDQWRLGPITAGPEQVPAKLPKAQARVSPASDDEQRKRAPVDSPVLATAQVRPLGSAPRFLKPLTDETVAESDRVQLEARVAGDPEPNIKVNYLHFSISIFDTVIWQTQVI